MSTPTFGDNVSIIARIEQAIADRLAAQTYDGSAVFETADVWKGQLAEKDALAALVRYAPCAFVAYAREQARREGGDLCNHLIFAVWIGQVSTAPGLARIGGVEDIGGTLKLGVLALREIVIGALDGWHPGGELPVDPMYHDGGNVIVDKPNAVLMEQRFGLNYITD